MENLKPIKVKLLYDEEIKKITKKDFEEAVVSEELNFVGLLYFIFSSYPDIQKRFPPGKLGMLLDGKRPTEYDILKDKDEIKLIGMKG